MAEVGLQDHRGGKAAKGMGAHAPLAPLTLRWVTSNPSPDLAIIVPTLNERDNVEPLIERLQQCLCGIDWEVIFVDDDSRDGTAEALLRLQQRHPFVRVLRRIGRRGLASACIEGMLATPAAHLAVIDADGQHDETVLPRMLQALKGEDLDVVVGSRFAAGGSAAHFSGSRLWLSRLGGMLSRLVTRAELSDPLSGYFMLRREFLEETVHDLSGRGFKLLLDLFASARRRVRFAEIPYRFSLRQAGESKLDASVMLEYVRLIGEKLLGRFVPIRFVLFVLVGAFGVAVHLAFLALGFKLLGLPFYHSQAIATLGAMTVNFNLNNALTYRDLRLRGRGLVYGHLSFYLICSIGAIANFQIAQMLYEFSVPWALAGLLGAVVGAVWNYGVSSTFTWRASG